jgi:hypothetical protein
MHNAIPLCQLCHRNFDDPYDNSFFFVPSDLNYFVAFEKDDRKRRRRLWRREGSLPDRICPTAETYKEHQIRQGKEAESGGLYTRLVLRDYFARYAGRPHFVPGLSEFGAEKSWSGSPMTALHRAVLTMKRLNISGIPQNIRDGLRELQDIYSEPLSLPVSGDSDYDSDPDESNTHMPQLGQASDTSYGSGDTQQGQPGDKSQGSGDGIPDNEGMVMDDVGPSISETTEDMLKSQAVLPNQKIGRWCWGPKATTNDVLEFYNVVKKL